MDFFSQALSFDIDKRYLDAINFYEKAILNDEGNIDAYINLSFLYWQSASEFWFRDKYKIPKEVSEVGVARYEHLLDMAIIKYPKSAELRFWKKYFPYRIFGDIFTYEEAISILHTYEVDSLVPYFFLYLFDKSMYRKERENLLRECSLIPTAKNLYIISIIDD